MFPQSTDKGVDVAILLDVSDNTASLDFTLLREAIKLFISLLSEEDRVTVIPCGKHGIASSPLMLNIPQNRPALFNEMDRQTSQDGLRADTPLQAAYEELLKVRRRNRGIVFIGSGKSAAAFGNAETRKKVLPDLLADHVKVYVISVTDKPEQEPPATLARETGGAYYAVRTVTELHLVLSSIYEKLETPDILPVQGDVFVIDADVREASILISKKPGESAALVLPTGAQESFARHGRQATWYTATAYDLVELRGPQPGPWRISTSRSDGIRVYLRTDLRLEVLTDRVSAHRGDPVRIDVWLEKKGALVTDPAGLGLGPVVASVVDPEGKEQLLSFTASANPVFGACKTGVFTATLIPGKEGLHAVKIFVSGKNFVRQRETAFSVISLPEGRPGQASTFENVRWGSVLMQFVLVNAAAAVLVGMIFMVKTLLLKLSATRRKR